MPMPAIRTRSPARASTGSTCRCSVRSTVGDRKAVAIEAPVVEGESIGVAARIDETPLVAVIEMDRRLGGDEIEGPLVVLTLQKPRRALSLGLRITNHGTITPADCLVMTTSRVAPHHGVHLRRGHRPGTVTSRRTRSSLGSMTSRRPRPVALFRPAWSEAKAWWLNALMSPRSLAVR